MRNFLFESSLFTVCLCLTFYGIFYLTDGRSDDQYLLFATSKQSSLILGTSKAAQGIQPQYINPILNRNDIFNFSFTIGHSPYGPIYLNCIKKKLKSETKGGVFILTVDPWSISSESEDPNDTLQFRESVLSTGQINNVNIHPNFDYLLNFYSKQYYKILYPLNENNTFLHSNGWLEISINTDSILVEKKIIEKIKVYKGRALAYNYSSARMNYLLKTIHFLKEHGAVFLVRLPIHPKIKEIEDDFIPNFNSFMQAISSESNTPYLDMTLNNSDYSYTDGNHLQRSSGRKASEEIAHWVLAQKLNIKKNLK